MCGGKIAHDRAFPSLVLDKIIIQHAQYFVGVDIASARIDNAEPVAVAVHRDAEVIAAGNDGVMQMCKSFFTGRRHLTTEIGVFIDVNGIDGAACRYGK